MDKNQSEFESSRRIVELTDWTREEKREKGNIQVDSRSRETGGKIFWKFAQSPPHFCFVCLVFVDLYTQSKRRGEREENTFNVITFIKLNVYTCHRRVRDAIGFEALWEKEGVVGQTPKQHGLSFFFFFLLFFFIFLTSFLCFFPEYGFNSRLATFTC